MRPYFIRLFLPNFAFANPEDIHKFPPDAQIRFDPERTGNGTSLFEHPTDSTHYNYYCISCYAAGGYKDACFKTSARAAKYKLDGPTLDQQQEMKEHGEQHSIIYQWAKGILK